MASRKVWVAAAMNPASGNDLLKLLARDGTKFGLSAQALFAIFSSRFTTTDALNTFLSLYPLTPFTVDMVYAAARGSSRPVLKCLIDRCEKFPMEMLLANINFNCSNRHDMFYKLLSYTKRPLHATSDAVKVVLEMHPLVAK
jgi:hypothetical protein